MSFPTSKSHQKGQQQHTTNHRHLKLKILCKLNSDISNMIQYICLNSYRFRYQIQRVSKKLQFIKITINKSDNINKTWKGQAKTFSVTLLAPQNQLVWEGKHSLKMPLPYNKFKSKNKSDSITTAKTPIYFGKSCHWPTTNWLSIETLNITKNHIQKLNQ